MKEHPFCVIFNYQTRSRINETTEAVQHLQQEFSDLKQEVVQWKHRLFESEFSRLAEDIDKCCYVMDDLNGTDLRAFANLLRRNSDMVLVMSNGKDGDFQYVLACGSQDARVIGKQLNGALCGKGGGSCEMVQGTLSKTESDITEYFKKFI